MKDMTYRAILKRLLAPIWRNQKVYMTCLLVASSWFLFDVVTILVLKHVGTGIQKGNLEYVYSIVLWYSILFVVFYIWKPLMKNKTRVKYRETFDKDIFVRHLKQYVSLDNTTIERLWTWRVYSIVFDGLKNWTDILLEFFVSVPELIIKLSIAIYIVFALWTLYGVVFLLMLAGAIIVMRFLNKKTQYWRWKRKVLSIQYNRMIVRMIMNKFEIMQSNKWFEEWERLKGMYTDFYEIDQKLNTPQFWTFNVGLIVVQLLTVVILWVSYFHASAGIFDFWLFAALSALTGYLVQMMLSFAHRMKSISQYMTHVEKLWEFFDSTPQVIWYEEWNWFSYKKGVFELQGLTYWYSKEVPIFRGFSLTLQWGKKTALVWISWSWKSTLVKLLSWYIAPDSGKILVDWQDLNEVSLKSYYPHIGYLTQEPSVFDGTIKENLLYAVDKATEEQLNEAITLANCQFVYDLQDWLDTEIWERGVRLSGGERQRLAIAKIFLKNPKIILLDEPTSALDSFSEEAITQAMHSLFKNRTVIIIAHRLQTVKEADDIILLGMSSGSGSQVLERGTHEELVVLWWEYARMLEVQTWF